MMQLNKLFPVLDMHPDAVAIEMADGGFIVAYDGDARVSNNAGGMSQESPSLSSLKFEKYDLNGVKDSSGMDKENAMALRDKYFQKAQNLNKINFPPTSEIAAFIALHPKCDIREGHDMETGKVRHYLTYVDEARREQTGFASVFQASFDKDGHFIDTHEISKSGRFTAGQDKLKEQMDARHRLSVMLNMSGQLKTFGYENE